MFHRARHSRARRRFIGRLRRHHTLPLMVTVYLATRPHSMTHGYRPGGTYVLADRFLLDHPGDAGYFGILDRVFVALNGHPRPADIEHTRRWYRRRHRSLSVGSVVALDHRHYACAATGWRPVPPTGLTPPMRSASSTVGTANAVPDRFTELDYQTSWPRRPLSTSPLVPNTQPIAVQDVGTPPATCVAGAGLGFAVGSPRRRSTPTRLADHLPPGSRLTFPTTAHCSPHAPRTARCTPPSPCRSTTHFHPHPYPPFSSPPLFSKQTSCIPEQQFDNDQRKRCHVTRSDTLTALN